MNDLIVNCYKAKIEKLGENEYEIYLYDSAERDGDTRILVKGEIKVFREVTERTKKGNIRFRGFVEAKIG